MQHIYTSAVTRATTQRLSLLGGWAVAVLLAGCAVPQATRPQESLPSSTAVPGPTPAAVAAAGEAWIVSSDESLITIEVLRGGALAQLGHNHVIAARQIGGELRLAEPIERSSLTLRLPVAQFTVDEPPLRAVAGPDFSAPVPDAARTGTRSNMLGGTLLDAEHFPVIELRSRRVRRTLSGIDVELQVHIRDVQRTLQLPVVLSRDNDALVASGELALRQSELGLTPFSIMLGALQVQDAMRIKFRVVAHPAARR